MTTPEDRLRTELAALADVPMPPDVADRIGRAVDDARVAPPRLRRRRPGRVLVPLAAAVAVVLAGVSVITGLRGGGADTPRTVGQEDDLRATGAVAFGRDGAGTLADPARRGACLTATGVPEPDAPLLGGMPYTVDGAPGTLLVLGTAETGRYRLVVVDPACRRVLVRTTVGR